MGNASNVAQTPASNPLHLCAFVCKSQVSAKVLAGLDILVINLPSTAGRSYAKILDPPPHLNHLHNHSRTSMPHEICWLLLEPHKTLRSATSAKAVSSAQHTETESRRASLAPDGGRKVEAASCLMLAIWKANPFSKALEGLSSGYPG